MGSPSNPPGEFFEITIDLRISSNLYSTPPFPIMEDMVKVLFLGCIIQLQYVTVCLYTFHRATTYCLDHTRLHILPEVPFCHRTK